MKNRRILFGIYGTIICFLLVSGAILFGSIFLRDKTETQPLSCENANFIFGRIPVVNGKSIARHTFAIKNNTNHDIEIEKVVSSCPCLTIENADSVVPANGFASCTVCMTLDASDITERLSELIVVSADKSIGELILSVRGITGFATYIENSGIVNFGTVYRNDTKTETQILSLNTTSERGRANVIKEIILSSDSMITFKKLQEKREGMRDSFGDFLFQQNPVLFSLVVNKESKLGENRENATLVLDNGEKRNLIFVWHAKERPVFDTPSVYLVAIAPKEIRDFNVVYNKNAGGIQKNILVVGNGLKIVSTDESENTIKINLQFETQSNLTKQTTVGKLLVETLDRRKYEVPIVIP